MKLRWGICTAGHVSHDFVVALSTLPADDHAVVAVAARSKKNAREFAERHNIPAAYEGYQALAEDANVDVVYIGAWNHVHLSLCKLFLGQGKNVLCEKPLGLNKREVQEMINLAKEKDVFFMEGLWSRFFPAMEKLRELLTDDVIGDIKAVNGTFGMVFPDAERLYNIDYGGGGLLDVGIYLVQAALMIFNMPPTSCCTKGFLTTDKGVDETTVITMLFPNKAVATLTCSIVVELPNEIDIRGTRGHIKIHSLFSCPTKLEVTTLLPKERGGERRVFEYPLPEVEVKLYNLNGVGFRYEAEAVRKCIMNGLKECPLVSHEDSLRVAEILQDARNDINYGGE